MGKSLISSPELPFSCRHVRGYVDTDPVASVDFIMISHKESVR